MILFKCDVCGVECKEKVISCQLVFGAKNISTNEVGSTATMHATELCEGCFKRLWKCIGYTDCEMASVKDVL
jgi:hypothetical protein